MTFKNHPATVSAIVQEKALNRVAKLAILLPGKKVELIIRIGFQLPLAEYFTFLQQTDCFH